MYEFACFSATIVDFKARTERLTLIQGLFSGERISRTHRLEEISRLQQGT